MKLAYYERHTDSGVMVDVSWDAFVADLQAHVQVTADKDARHAIGPHILKGPRSNENVVSMTFQGLDYDRLTLPQVEQVITRVSRFQGIAYTTWSQHTEKAHTLRVLLPREDSISQWAKHRKALERYIGIPSDKATHDPARLFYLPARRPQDPPPLFAVLTGAPFDPYMLPGERRITGEDFEALRKALAYKARTADHPEKRQRINIAVHALDAILEGRAYADAGAIDPTLVSLIGHFKAAWGTNIDTDSILEIMSRSLAVMPSDRSYDHARERVERLFAKARAEARDDNEERIRQHFKRLGRPDRTEPYTDDEIAYMRESFCDRDQFALLVQAKGDLYGLTIEGFQNYGPIAMSDVVRALSPFPDVNFRSTAGGVKQAKPLVDDLGQHASALEYSYLQTRSTFNGSILSLATAPRRPIVPIFDPEMDAWITILGGEKAPALRQWLAWVPHLDQALMALHLHGPPGTGKSLFATAIARPWGPPTSMHHAFDTFNDGMLQCPIILADEHFPTHQTNAKAYKTQEFRELVQNSAHRVHPKFKGLSVLRGYVRCIVATNNKQMFKLAGNVHSKDDIDAIHERTLRVHVSEASRDYLASIDAASIAKTDRFMAHVLTFPRPDVAHRFGLEPQPLDYALVVDLFIPNHVLGLFFTHLSLDGKFPPGYRVHEGALHVIPAYVKLAAELKIKPAHLHEAIESISEGQDGLEYRIANRALEEYATSVGQTKEWLEERLEHHENVNQKEAN